MTCRLDFDFDLMARLAKEDPAEFARHREELIRDMIESFPNPEEGRRLQFEIDMERIRTPPGEKTFLAMAERLGLLLGQMATLFDDIRGIAEQSRLRHR